MDPCSASKISSYRAHPVIRLEGLAFVCLFVCFGQNIVMEILVIETNYLH